MDWNATVKCIWGFNPGKGATLGQAYKVEDGRITYDNGEKQRSRKTKKRGVI